MGNEDPDTVVPVAPDREGYVRRAMEQARAAPALGQKDMFRADAPDPVEELPEAADFCANMPEGCELVPMHNRPTLQIIRFRRREKPDPEAVRRFVYGLYRRLEEACCMIPQRDDRGAAVLPQKKRDDFSEKVIPLCV